jgi:ATP-dependent protease Clp ATPase subunit
MYSVPSESSVTAVKITADVVVGKEKPVLVKKPKEGTKAV